MKVLYDPRTDTLSVILKDDVAVAESDVDKPGVILEDDVAVAESDVDKPGVILDYHEAGGLVSLQILDASKRVTEARKIEFRAAG